MHGNILHKLEQLSARHEEVSALLADPETIGKQEQFRNLSREYAQLEPVRKAYTAYRKKLADIDAVKEILREGDSEMRVLAQDELDQAESKLETLEKELY